MIAEVCPVGGTKGEQLHPLVSSLVDYLWAETIGELETLLSVPVQNIKMEQVTMATTCRCVPIYIYYINRWRKQKQP